jgi:phenylacetate-coenzyme A ligase PaaK-like adenylate-forming protein
MDAWIRHVLEIHTQPELGSPFWIEKARTADFNLLRSKIESSEDLLKFGLMNEEELSGKPLMDFIPRKYWRDRADLITGETGGTGGIVKTTAYRTDEWRAAFVDNFVSVARHRGFPGGGNWLYLGPTGPHMIGKAAVACARAMGSMEPFAVDFDPRWFGKLPEESLSRKRYIDHILSQALRILVTQPIEVIFATPKILAMLSDHLTPEIRRRIRGVHFGGMAVSKDLYRMLREEIFPEAVFISGYGNTLLGVSLEVEFDESYDITYYPFGERMVFNVVREGDFAVPVPHGEEGRLVVSRFDETFMIINLIERDVVTKVSGDLDFPGVSGCAIKNPVPARINFEIKDGIY